MLRDSQQAVDEEAWVLSLSLRSEGNSRREQRQRHTRWPCGLKIRLFSTPVPGRRSGRVWGDGQ